MSNYPDGVDKDTLGAPWNEKEIEIGAEITLFMSIKIPYQKEFEFEKSEIYDTIKSMILEDLKQTNLYYEINNIKIN